MPAKKSLIKKPRTPKAPKVPQYAPAKKISQEEQVLSDIEKGYFGARCNCGSRARTYWTEPAPHTEECPALVYAVIALLTDRIIKLETEIKSLKNTTLKV